MHFDKVKEYKMQAALDCKPHEMVKKIYKQRLTIE